jgi:hypothetical protein
MEVYERATRGVPRPERLPIYELYVVRASEFFGVGKVRRPGRLPPPGLLRAVAPGLAWPGCAPHAVAPHPTHPTPTHPTPTHPTPTHPTPTHPTPTHPTPTHPYPLRQGSAAARALLLCAGPGASAAAPGQRPASAPPPPPGARDLRERHRGGAAARPGPGGLPGAVRALRSAGAQAGRGGPARPGPGRLLPPLPPLLLPPTQLRERRRAGRAVARCRAALRVQRHAAAPALHPNHPDPRPDHPPHTPRSTARGPSTATPPTWPTRARPRTSGPSGTSSRWGHARLGWPGLAWAGLQGSRGRQPCAVPRPGTHPFCRRRPAPRCTRRPPLPPPSRARPTPAPDP